MSNNGKVFRTDSMAVAAYLHNVRKGEHGIFIRSAMKIGGPEKFEFVFSDPDDMAKQMVIDYANSESRMFDDGMRSVKTMLYSAPRSRRQSGS